MNDRWPPFARRLGVLSLVITAACSESTAPLKPSALATVSGPPATSTVGTQIAITVVVKDQQGEAIAGQPLTVTLSGGGTVTGAPAKTLAGATTVGTWTLGTKAGTNTLTIASGTLPPLVFTVVAQADVPATIQVTQGTGQSANAGSALLVPPSVTIVDRFGNGVPRQAVTFTVTAGGGSLASAAAVVSDTNGVATAPAWTLGKRNIPQQLTATTGTITQAINATIQTSMSIVLRFFGTMTDAQKAVFQGAAQRVSAMVTQGAAPIQATAFPVSSTCDVPGAAPITELIAGIIIYASIDSIDGPKTILAESGPCAFRGSDAHFQPAVAIMRFDSSDVATLTGGGSLEDVATHEMMHALGFGTLWASNQLVTGTGTSNPRYVGTNGINGCQAIGGATTCATSVPVENTGGSGTAGSHWRESVFTNELMTGFLNSGVNPLSRMTIASMVDFGYSVSLTAADPFSIASALRAPAGARLVPDNWERLRRQPSPALLEQAGGLWRARIDP